MKIQPAAFAPKGARMPNTASCIRRFERGTVPFRVSQSATAAANAAMPPKPIMMRNPQ